MRSPPLSTSVLEGQHLNKVIWYLVVFFSTYIFVVSEQVTGLRFYLPSLLLIVVQSLSHVRPFVTPWTAARLPYRLPCQSPSPRACSNSCPLSRGWHPTISSSVVPPSIFLSIRVFSSESALYIRWPKYWSFSFTISLSNE